MVRVTVDLFHYKRSKMNLLSTSGQPSAQSQRAVVALRYLENGSCYLPGCCGVCVTSNNIENHAFLPLYSTY